MKAKQKTWAEFEEIVKGIDETEVNGGWWETSTGAEFGKNKKKELKKYLAKELQAERGRVLDEVDKEFWPQLHKDITEELDLKPGSDEFLWVNQTVGFALGVLNTVLDQLRKEEV